MPDEQGKRSTRRQGRARTGDGPPLTLIDGDGTGNGSGKVPGQTLRAADGGNRRRPPRVNKARLSVILFGLLVLAVISTVFGMMMAVAQDLPSLETTNEFKASKNSILTDNTGKKRLAVLTGNENRILVGSGDISPSVKHAVIAIEDKRFFAHKGVDYQGIARALWQDVLRRKAAQGGSTITQQFVKNALLAQTNRSIFQKLKEAALAYQLERKWSKDKILTQYLNTVYFGEGAYGIESAARIYFGWDHPGCEPHCAAALDPAEAALLAGLIASPSAYSPVQNPAAALKRRNLVLDNMQGQGFSARSSTTTCRACVAPVDKVSPPHKISSSPYFTAWVSSSWSTATAPGRPSAVVSRSAPRSTSSSRRRPRRRSRGSAASARRRRWWRSTTRRCACARWSADPISRSSRSTSRHRAGASPALRSSLSRSSRRSRRASRRVAHSCPRPRR